MLGYGVLKKIFNYKPACRTGRFLIFIWLLSIPTQLGMHFWPEWSHVMGLRVDYLSPTIYFVDILWILMSIKILISNNQKTISKQITITKKQFPNKKYILFLVFVLINIFVAGNQWVAIVRWLRIFQWIITFNLIVNNKKLFKEMLVKVLPFWIIGESLLGLAQVVNGGSLNGIFYWLGERRFSYVSLGVAQISYLGQGLIRAYGTFSHPNSMAGFLLISLIIFYKNKRNVFYWVVMFCGLLGIVLSGSRTVWAIGIILLIFNLKFIIFNQFLILNFKKILGMVLILGGVIILIFSLINFNYNISDFVGGWDGDGMVKRGALMVASLKMIKDNPLFGVGANNFLVSLPEYQKNSGVFWLQPVHNILFLIVSEFGIVGLILLFILLGRYRNLPLQKGGHIGPPVHWIILGIILVTGMMDHYWLTLPQNWWLMCVVLSLI